MRSWKYSQHAVQPLVFPYLESELESGILAHLEGSLEKNKAAEVEHEERLYNINRQKHRAADQREKNQEDEAWCTILLPLPQENPKFVVIGREHMIRSTENLHPVKYMLLNQQYLFLVIVKLKDELAEVRVIVIVKKKTVKLF